MFSLYPVGKSCELVRMDVEFLANAFSVPIEMVMWSEVKVA